MSLEYLLGILNSKLIGFYARKMFGTTAMQGGYIELRTFEIKDIPIQYDEKTQKSIVNLVNAMLDLSKRAQMAKSSEKERIQTQISQTDREIDELVYKLYGLTDEEVKIIEKGRDGE